MEAVEVRKRAFDGDACLARLRAGDEFGEMSLIDIQPRSASVVACEATELYVLGNMDLLALYEEDLASYTFFLPRASRSSTPSARSIERSSSFWPTRGLWADLRQHARG
jgi:CRP-like cAMP-binding protein